MEQAAGETGGEKCGRLPGAQVQEQLRLFENDWREASELLRLQKAISARTVRRETLDLSPPPKMSILTRFCKIYWDENNGLYD